MSALSAGQKRAPVSASQGALGGRGAPRAASGRTPRATPMAPSASGWVEAAGRRTSVTETSTSGPSCPSLPGAVASSYARTARDTSAFSASSVRGVEAPGIHSFGTGAAAARPAVGSGVLGMSLCRKKERVTCARSRSQSVSVGNPVLLPPTHPSQGCALGETLLASHHSVASRSMRGGGPAYLRSLFAEDQGCDLARRQVCNMLAIDSVKHVADLERCPALRRTAGNKAADYVPIARRDLERDSHAAQSCLRWVLRAAHRVLPCGK